MLTTQAATVLLTMKEMLEDARSYSYSLYGPDDARFIPIRKSLDDAIKQVDNIWEEEQK